MVKSRIATEGRMAMFGGPGVRARWAKLRNRRVILATDNDKYCVEFRHLTDEKKVHKLKFVVTPEALFALIELFMELKGPLPVGVKWTQAGGIDVCSEEVGEW